jgi:hypothetical protein
MRIIAVALLCTLAAFGQHKPPRNAKVFILPTEGELHSLLAQEIVKQKLPLVLVTEEALADYVLTGISSTGDKNEGNARLVHVREKTVAWVGEADDGAAFWGLPRRGGQRKVAGRIVHQMKKDLFSSTWDLKW